MYFWLKYYMYSLRKKRNSFSLDTFYMSGPLSVHFNGVWQLVITDIFAFFVSGETWKFL